MGKLQTYFISNKLSSDIIKPGEYFPKFKTMSTIPASLYDRQGKTFPTSRKNPANLNQIKKQENKIEGRTREIVKGTQSEEGKGRWRS